MRKEYFNDYYGMFKTQMGSKIIPTNIYGAINRASFLANSSKERIIELIKDNVIETHYFIKNPIYDEHTENIKRRLDFHINTIVVSAMVQFYNTNYIFDRLKMPEFKNCKLTVDDLYKSTYFWIEKLFKNKSTYNYKPQIDAYFKKFSVKSIQDMEKNYRNLYYIKKLMNVDGINGLKPKSCEIRDFEYYYSSVKIYNFRSKIKDIGYASVTSYDGEWQLYFEPVQKEFIYRWYVTERKSCVKWLKEKLSPYFVPSIGYNVHFEKVGLQNFFTSLEMYKRRHPDIEPLNKLEIRYYRDCLEKYIDRIAAVVGDQTSAIEYIKNNNADDETSSIEEPKEDPMTEEEFFELYFDVKPSKPVPQFSDEEPNPLIEPTIFDGKITYAETLTVHDVDSYLRIKDTFSTENVNLELEIDNENGLEVGSNEWWDDLKQI